MPRLSKKTLSALVSLVVLLILAGRSLFSTSSSLSPTSSPSPVANPQVLGIQNQHGLETAVVARAIDGDTIELSDGRKVRYIGVDTPETHHPTKGVQCFGQEAAKRNQEIIKGKTVQLEKDVSETDRYGRLLRYVWLDQTMINQQLVNEGFAFASSYPPDIARQDIFKQTEAQAREANRGLWSSCPLDLTTKINQTIQANDQQLVSPDPSQLQSKCVIKGNISESGKLYHLPKCSAYNSVKIDESKGERWFCNELEATQSGWTKAGSC